MKYKEWKSARLAAAKLRNQTSIWNMTHPEKPDVSMKTFRAAVARLNFTKIETQSVESLDFVNL